MDYACALLHLTTGHARQYCFLYKISLYRSEEVRLMTKYYYWCIHSPLEISPQQYSTILPSLKLHEHPVLLLKGWGGREGKAKPSRQCKYTNATIQPIIWESRGREQMPPPSRPHSLLYHSEYTFTPAFIAWDRGKKRASDWNVTRLHYTLSCHTPTPTTYVIKLVKRSNGLMKSVWRMA